MSEAYKKIRETCTPRGEFKNRYCFFPDTPNIGRKCRIIWKDLLWSSDSCRLLEYRGGCTIPLFQLSVRCEKCVAARNYAVICKQLLNANDKNRVRWVVLGLLQDRASTHFFENFSENTLEEDLSNATTFNPPLFSLVVSFKKMISLHTCFDYWNNEKGFNFIYIAPNIVQIEQHLFARVQNSAMLQQFSTIEILPVRTSSTVSF